MAYRDFAAARAAGVALILGLGLAGCASNPPETATAPTAAAEMAANPIDPNDPLAPWVPYIREASERFDVPEKWIRAVMVRESGGRSLVNGRTITSSAGAIGLMQVMPATYEMLRWQYGFGPDPSNPRDNILAGTAYLREMYDLFGAPGFLAAYNCGPACYASYLAKKQKLPRETKMYLAALTPALRGTEPRTASQSAGATAIEIAVVPDNAPAPKAPAPSTITVAQEPPRPEARPDPGMPAPAAAPVAVAALEPPPQRAVEPRGRASSASNPPVEFVAAADRSRITTHTLAVKPGTPPAHSLETMVAEAVLPPNAAGKGERVVIRFVSQRSGGCGSMQGKERVCVALAGGNAGL
ncbi:lytic transglycosylase domain-containing protein [Azospirillum sp. sgz302134]